MHFKTFHYGPGCYRDIIVIILKRRTWSSLPSSLLDNKNHWYPIFNTNYYSFFGKCTIFKSRWSTPMFFQNSALLLSLMDFFFPCKWHEFGISSLPPPPPTPTPTLDGSFPCCPRDHPSSWCAKMGGVWWDHYIQGWWRFGSCSFLDISPTHL